MAGDWLKFDKATPDKPEVFAIATELQIDPDAVVGKLMRVWSWFDSHTSDGNAHCVASALLDRCAGITGFVTAMKNAGWIEVHNGGCRLPNFDRHCGETSKKRALGARRSAAFRVSNGSCVTDALPREEKRREENKEQKQEPLRSPNGSRLPPDWTLPDEWRRWAEQERRDVDVLRESRVFADYWASQPGAKGRKTDWQATWRNWIRRAQGRPRAGPQQQQLGKQAQGLMALEAMKSGNRMAAGRDIGGSSEALLLGVGSDASGRDPAGYG